MDESKRYKDLSVFNKAFKYNTNDNRGELILFIKNKILTILFLQDFLPYFIVFGLLLTIFLIVFIILIIKRIMRGKIKTDENIESLNNDDDDDGDLKFGRDKLSKNKYGTLESIVKKENEIGNKKLKLSSSWPFNIFLLRNFISRKSEDKNKIEYSLKEMECKNEMINKTSEILVDELVIKKLMPIRLNYSLKYEGLVLKIEIISIELENKSNVLLNPYVRIELIKNNADGENTNTNSAFEFDSNDIDPLNQYKACKTRIIRNQLELIYNETFFFNDLINLNDYNLILSVYSTNKFSRDLFIGHLRHDFSGENNGSIISKELIYDNTDLVSLRVK